MLSYMHINACLFDRPALVAQSDARLTGDQDILFCVEVLRPGQPRGVMSSTISLPNHTFTWQA